MKELALNTGKLTQEQGDVVIDRLDITSLLTGRLNLILTQRYHFYH